MHNPLDSYRKTQRELRREFDAFTRSHCGTCPTPCCVKPARLELVDIKLAERTGWKSRLPQSESFEHDGSETKEESSAEIVVVVDDETGELVRQPCEYLKDGGCSFPADLRPFGCTAYICQYMHDDLNRAQLNRIKRLIRIMDDQYRAILKTKTLVGTRRT